MECLPATSKNEYCESSDTKYHIKIEFDIQYSLIIDNNNSKITLAD